MSDQEETTLLDDLGAAWDEIDEETTDVEDQQSEPAEAEPDLANLDEMYTDHEFEVDYADFLDWAEEKP